MIMVTRSSEKVFNPSRYTGNHSILIALRFTKPYQYITRNNAGKRHQHIENNIAEKQFCLQNKNTLHCEIRPHST